MPHEMDFQTLLEPSQFADDEPVGVAAVDASELPGPLQPQSWHYVPDRLWKRLLHLGNAYELHFAQIVEPVIDTVLSPIQSQSLTAELSFLASFVNDEALLKAIATITQCSEAVARSTKLRLVLSPP